MVDFWQFVVGELIQELGCIGVFYDMFGECSCIDQINVFVDCFCFINCMLLLVVVMEGVVFFVEIFWCIEWIEIVWMFLVVYLVKLCVMGFLMVISWCSLQWMVGFVFFIRVVQDVDVFIVFFVFVCCEFGGYLVVGIVFGV